MRSRPGAQHQSAECSIASCVVRHTRSLMDVRPHRRSRSNALLSENVCVRDSWHGEVGRGAEGTATLEFRKAKLMAKPIATLPKELVGVSRGGFP